MKQGKSDRQVGLVLSGYFVMVACFCWKDWRKWWGGTKKYSSCPIRPQHIQQLVVDKHLRAAHPG
ncbi:MAG TPA: hypothetical protein VHS96_17070, partial [Bacteroidia bacterium]|nr:hypothetical protein [Bacteroidia bacterium]